ncbi:aldo/keto reductase [Actinocrispum sp. NPDC049592]|uniref:aldo/keto reductase n=1 Tax=Actinocrispum sp. NPDC049592 TaxID=3154835 RepID=UPI0034487B1A
MRTRRIGETEVSAIGLGGMPLSVDGRPDEQRAVATIHAALDAGITLIDTADAYSLSDKDFGHNEELIAGALKSYGAGDEILVATKGGHTRLADGGWGLNGTAEYIKQACEASLRRLGVEAIGLYQFHRPDPRTPIEESVEAVRDLLDAGKIRYAGVSNFNPAQIRTANEILGGRLAAVQNQFSPVFRSSEPELELCAELGIAFLPWSPLGGIGKAGRLGGGVFDEVGAAHGVSPQRACLAWMLAKADVVIPIPGSSRPESIRDSAAAAELVLSPDEVKKLDTA